MNGTKNSYAIGTRGPSWGTDDTKNITFIVTEECNLLCKYCYLTGKNSTKKMTFEIAKKAIDYILNDKKVSGTKSVIWEFIGGEPFLEIELINQICDYIKLQTYTLGHQWFDSYRFNFSTNGILYNDAKVQEYISKNHKHLSIGITIDGTKKKHDLQRVYPDGRGSYDDVIKNIPLWKNQFPNTSTKVTFGSADLQYLKESIIHLWEMGLNIVPANVVFENVWNEGDDVIFERQLKELADYILEHKLWREYSVKFFDENMGHPLNEDDLNGNWCGSGMMLAIDWQGNFFPCLRFADYSLNNQQSYKIGDVYNGINYDLVRPFMVLDIPSQSKEECVNCEVASGCAWCQGCNYDSADTETIYQRATFICKMHKANSRVNHYFWEKFKEKTGIVPEGYEKNKKLRKKALHRPNLLFITAEDITPHCNYQAKPGSDIKMSQALIEKGLAFAKENGMTSVFLTNESKSEFFTIGKDGMDLPIYQNSSFAKFQPEATNCILLVTKNDLMQLAKNVAVMLQKVRRINIILQDLPDWTEVNTDVYKAELEKIVAYLTAEYQAGREPEINVLTDVLNLKQMENCEAGETSFTLAPNGKLYICPAFYFNNPDDVIGSLEEGLQVKNADLLTLQKSPLCKICDVYHCERCKYLNKKLTHEINIPAKMQCVVSHIERNTARKLQQEIAKLGQKHKNVLLEIDYLDPLTQIDCLGNKIYL